MEKISLIIPCKNEVESLGVVLEEVKDNKFVDSAKTGDEIEIITNQTPFYGESGGQVGDEGEIISGDFKLITSFISVNSKSAKGFMLLTPPNIFGAINRI